ncbi:golgin IMH1-like [Zingiber officinale]|uniref:C2 NT-type domain-containing protein n=1 Tax=Zingiber officinale TaxID=94328 RepID=A0A8J5GD12_ZINOF|nr:golgin IMH1-like [Zingiber officinale]KAG6500899.1 hypothetical protein ZIOFF_040761 [Zingiber officinale]
MFKAAAARWRSNDKNKLKVVFKFQLQATQILVSGTAAGLSVSLVPLDVGKPTSAVKSEKVSGGCCRWSSPVYETVKLERDPKSGKIHDKFYKFLVSESGSTRSGQLGEAIVNLADYVEFFKPCSLSLPLKAGTLLHVTLQRMQGEGEIREAEENGDATSGKQGRTMKNQLIEEEVRASSRKNDTDPMKERFQTYDESLNLDAASVASSESSSDLIHGSIHRDSAVLKISSGDSSGSANSSSESGFDTIDKLRREVFLLSRKVEVSELEIQTMRKQIAKENRRAQELSQEISSLREERDALKSSRKETSEPDLDVEEDPLSMVEEIKQELEHEKNLNSSLRLQLQKTREANSELQLAVRDLDELVEQRDRTTDTSLACSLNDEIELYKRDREDLEMQMEQLALDYEILKQENHDITSHLEQTRLREQLRMQYECSAHSAIIGDLESHVECLEREIRQQAESFESDVEAMANAKTEEEKKALRAEGALRKANWNGARIAERLREELTLLSSQASSVFFENEKIVRKALKEVSELQSQRRNLAKTLEKNKEDSVSLQRHYQRNLRQLLDLLRFKSKEAERLQLQIRKKKEEFESCNNCLESSLEEIERHKTMLQNQNSEQEILKKEISSLKEEIIEVRNRRDEKENMIAMLNQEKENLGLKHKSLSEGELSKMAALKEKNKSMEADLKEMQERYSEISLKFAEVEGERQQLVMTIRTLKNALKN